VECTSAQRAATLGKLVSEEGLAGASVNLVLPQGQYQTFQLEQPAVEQDELADAVRWKLKDLLDYKVDDAVVDTFPFPEDASRGRGKLLNVVAARKSMIRELINLVDGSHLHLDRIDVAELALRNLTTPLSAENRSIALVYLREQHGLLLFCRGGLLYMARRLDITVEQLKDASAQEQVVQSLALEIQRSMDYYESQLRQVPPRIVHLMGHPSGLPLAGMLSTNVGATVQDVDWQVLNQGDAPDLRACLAMGAASAVPEVAE